MVTGGGGDAGRGQAVYLSLLRWKIGEVGRSRGSGRLEGKCVLVEGGGGTLPTGIFPYM